MLMKTIIAFFAVFLIGILAEANIGTYFHAQGIGSIVSSALVGALVIYNSNKK